MGGRSKNWSFDLGTMTNHQLPKIHRILPRTLGIHRTQFQTCHRKSLFSILQGSTSTDRVTNDKVVNTTYPNPNRTCGAKHFYYPKDPNHSTLQGFSRMINQSSRPSNGLRNACSYHKVLLLQNRWER
jgi:hypothetical protein